MFCSCCFFVFVLFLLFFVFFLSTKTMRQPFSGTAKRIFMKLSPNDRGGKCSLKRHAAAWRKSCRRLANVDALRNLRYDSFAITRGRHIIYAMTLAESPEGATGGCVIQQ